MPAFGGGIRPPFQMSHAASLTGRDPPFPPTRDVRNAHSRAGPSHPSSRQEGYCRLSRSQSLDRPWRFRRPRRRRHAGLDPRGLLSWSKSTEQIAEPTPRRLPYATSWPMGMPNPRAGHTPLRPTFFLRFYSSTKAPSTPTASSPASRTSNVAANRRIE